MNTLTTIAQAYAAGNLSSEDAETRISALDLPVFDSDWDGKFPVSGDVANDPALLGDMVADGNLTEAQLDELLSLLPEGYRARLDRTSLGEELSQG